MYRKMLLSINILISFFVIEVITQYNNQAFDETPRSNQYFPYKHLADVFKLYQNQQLQFNNNPEIPNYEEYNEYAEGICSCENCDNLKPYCRNMCPNCVSVPPLSKPYYYIPYPYPYPLTPENPEPEEEVATAEPTVHITTETSTTTAEATTTKMSTEMTTQLASKALTDLDSFSNLLDLKVPPKSFAINDKNPYIVTSIRRTRPNWIPKYGVLPISEQFAEKLMLKLRSMKVLHPRKDNFRDVDEVNPVN